MGGYMATAVTDMWSTPRHIIAEVIEEFGAIDLDPASSDSNAVCERYYTKEDDGLTQAWNADLVYVNPPYGRVIAEWVQKALHEYQQGNAQTIVMLLPARTCTKWFHLLYEKSYVELRFIKGRLKYGDGKTSAPFPSMLVIIGGLAND
tara:strand:+ start:353 stop:796 length:444 start_codon:yes stop_codon:yes gene_type:complete